MIKKGNIVEIQYNVLIEGKPFEKELTEKLPIGGSTTIEGIADFLLTLCEKEKEEVIGKKISLTIEPEKAYGLRQKNLIGAIPKTLMSENKVNDYVTLNLKDGNKLSGQVKSENEDTFIVDCNHPLVDKTLEVNIEILSVE